MQQIYNLKNQKSIRRILRQQPIRAEKILWQKIRMKQLGYRFRRQFGIGKFIVDFYCPKLKFAIELDGGTLQWTNIGATLSTTLTLIAALSVCWEIIPRKSQKGTVAEFPKLNNHVSKKELTRLPIITADKTTPNWGSSKYR